MPNWLSSLSSFNSALCSSLTAHSFSPLCVMLDLFLQGSGFCRCVCAMIGLENNTNPSNNTADRKSLAFTKPSLGATLALQAKPHLSGTIYEEVVLLGSSPNRELVYPRSARSLAGFSIIL